MEKILLYLTVYNVIFTLSRLFFAVIDQNGTIVKSMQFVDSTFYLVLPLIIFWSLLFITIPSAIYIGVSLLSVRFNRLGFSTLTANTLLCLTFIIILFAFGMNV